MATLAEWVDEGCPSHSKVQTRHRYCPSGFYSSITALCHLAYDSTRLRVSEPGMLASAIVGVKFTRHVSRTLRPSRLSAVHSLAYPSKDVPRRRDVTSKLGLCYL